MEPSNCLALKSNTLPSAPRMKSMPSPPPAPRMSAMPMPSIQEFDLDFSQQTESSPHAVHPSLMASIELMLSNLQLSEDDLKKVDPVRSRRN